MKTAGRMGAIFGAIYVTGLFTFFDSSLINDQSAVIGHETPNDR